jgi:hypothetical protein
MIVPNKEIATMNRKTQNICQVNKFNNIGPLKFKVIKQVSVLAHCRLLQIYLLQVPDSTFNKTSISFLDELVC